MEPHNDIFAQLASPDRTARLSAVRELALVNERVAVEYLLRAVRDPYSAVRELAFLRLIERGAVLTLNSLEGPVRDWQLHKAAARLERPSIFSERGVFADSHRTALDAAWQAFADEGTEAAERCLLGLMSSDSAYDLRDAAGYLLVKLGRTGDVVTNSLADLLGQNARGHVSNALLAMFYPDEWHLERSGHYLPKRSSFIERALPSSSFAIRHSIVGALGPSRAYLQLLAHSGSVSEEHHRVRTATIGVQQVRGNITLESSDPNAYCVARAIETLAVRFADKPDLLADVAAVCSDYEERNPPRDRAMY